MDVGSGVDPQRLLPKYDPDAPLSWWERCLGRTEAALHLDAIRAVRMNLALELLGGAALAWTIYTEKLRWRDVWGGLDTLLAVPTLFALLSYSADPPAGLARWCWVLLVLYALSVAFDVVWLLLGHWSKVSSRSAAALTDAGSLYLWIQCVYYNQQLAAAFAQQAAPIAYVTVSASHGHVDARLPVGGQ